MKRILFIAFALATGLYCISSPAQWNGCQAGFCNQVKAGATYQGPGDVVSGAKLWYGLRCYNAVYSGNVADIWDGSTGSTTETLITCDGHGNLVTSSPTAITTTCAVSCVIKTWYNQAGTLLCNTSNEACDETQATNANRFTLTLNCLGTLPCATSGGGSQGYAAAHALASAISQPLTFVGVAERTANATTEGDIGFVSSTAGTFGFKNSSGSVFGFLGSSLSASAAENTMHVIQVVAATGSNGIFQIDSGAPTTGLNFGANNPAGAPSSFANLNAHPLTGIVLEYGVWGVAFSTTQLNNMASNIKTYWGY